VTIDIKEQSESATLLIIQDEMTVYNVLEQKNILLPHLKADKELKIDLSGVAEIDSAGMQLLIMMKRRAKSINNQLILVHHSQAVTEVLALFNLTSFFGDPVIISANWET